jgi:hypothetical protein
MSDDPLPPLVAVTVVCGGCKEDVEESLASRWSRHMHHCNESVSRWCRHREHALQTTRAIGEGDCAQHAPNILMPVESSQKLETASDMKSFTVEAATALKKWESQAMAGFCGTLLADPNVDRRVGPVSEHGRLETTRNDIHIGVRAQRTPMTRLQCTSGGLS